MSQGDSLYGLYHLVSYCLDTLPAYGPPTDTGHVTVRDCKFQLAELWVQALGEASEDTELRKHLRRHMREVHDFLADLIRRGQEEGVLHPDRDADAEAWSFLAGGMLGMVGRRVGLLDDQEVKAIRTARLGWLSA